MMMNVLYVHMASELVMRSRRQLGDQRKVIELNSCDQEQVGKRTSKKETC